MALTQPAVSYLFDVKIEGLVLGSFTKIEGLGASYAITKVKEGGENGFVHQLPGRVDYSNIKITKPVDETSMKIASWFSTFQTRIDSGKHLEPATAEISAMNAAHEPVAFWLLGGVFPIRYSGPTFEAGGSSVLTETLELAHTGFLNGVL